MLSFVTTLIGYEHQLSNPVSGQYCRNGLKSERDNRDELMISDERTVGATAC
jgi:hypothetical protein